MMRSGSMKKRKMKLLSKKGKLYVVGPDGGYSEPWVGPLGLYDLVWEYKEADTVLFTGGSDISPELYGEANAHSWPAPQRDQFEVPYFHRAVEDGKAIIGICRGAQLVCALTGGKLFQHVDGHVGSHPMHTDDGRVMRTSSLHHQLMRPAGEFRLLAWSENRGGNTYLNEEHHDYGHPDSDKDPEVILHPKIRALGIQGHPEMLAYDHPTNDYFRSLAKTYIL